MTDNMSEQDQAHIAGHDKWSDPYAMLILRLYDCPHTDNPHAEQQGLADQPKKADAISPVSSHDFAHEQCAYHSGMMSKLG